MSIRTLFRAISRHAIGRAPAGAGDASENQPEIGRHHKGPAKTVFATDDPVRRGTRADAVKAATAIVIAAELARIQDQNREEGAWLNYGQR